MCRRKTAILMTSFAFPVLFLFNASHADERVDVRSAAEIADTQLEVKMRQATCQMAELQVAAVEVALERVALRLDHANTHGSEFDVANVKLDHKEATLQLAMRKLQLDLSRLELERAQSKLMHLEKLRVSSPQAEGKVRVEYIDDLEVLVIRGDKENVAKITDVIKQLQAKKKVDDK